MDDLPTLTVVPLQCNACRKAPATRGYSTCEPCRVRRSEASKRSKEKKRQEKARVQAILHASRVVNAKTPVVAAEKRKASNDDPGERFKLWKRARISMEVSAVKLDAIASTPCSVDSIFHKFLFASDLHKHLKRCYPDNSEFLSFYGTYAIIADPAIDNKQRARQVARDLKDNTSLDFHLESKKSTRSSDEAKTYTIRYSCTCHTPLKRTSSDLLKYFSKNKGGGFPEDEPQDECCGQLTIAVADDKSHPLGWLGQRVKVTFTHPKA